MSSLLIVGVPRSGTTWVGRALGRTDGSAYVNEPDGFRDPFAFRVMLQHGENPALAPGDPAPDYERLWTGALAGGRRPGTWRDRLAWRLYEGTPLDERRDARATGRPSARLRLVRALAVPRAAEPNARHVVVKSVQSILAVDWIAQRFRPRVLVVERHPFNVLASWIELDFVRNPRESGTISVAARERWGLEPPGPDAPRLEHQAFHYGVLSSALRDAAARHPEWITTCHEHLCVDSVVRFRALAPTVGLEWGEAADHFVTDSDREGRPYRTNRRAEEQPERWRERLDARQIATIRETLARFPHSLVPEG